MRRGDLSAILAMLVLASCATSTPPFRDMVGYVPPTSLPAQPRRTMVQSDLTQVWNGLLGFLHQSDFDIDHQDLAKRLIVARYSGNPEPFIDCGSIVTDENGVLGQVPGAIGQVSLNHDLDGQPVILNRFLSLDGRIIIRLQESAVGTVVSTDTTYVVTKTVNIETSSGDTVEGSHETVNFSAGKRAEFSKGTACQPTGSLDFAVLQGLPNVVGSNEIDRVDLPVDRSDDDSIDDRAIVGQFGDKQGEFPSSLDRDLDENSGNEPHLQEDGDLPSETVQSLKDWTYAEPDVTSNESPASSLSTAPSEERQVVNLDVEEKLSQPSKATESISTALATLPDELGDPDVDSNNSPSIVDETTKTLLRALDCQGDEWHFCEMVKLTSPYRKLNIEKALGLTINTAERVITHSVGSDLKLNVDLPTFSSYLHIVYVERSGFIDHVVTSSTPSPADLSQRLQEIGHAIPGPSGLALIVAIVSEQPLFPSGEIEREEAGNFLRSLEQRFAEIDARSDKNRIAASQLLINVE